MFRYFPGEENGFPDIFLTLRIVTLTKQKCDENKHSGTYCRA